MTIDEHIIANDVLREVSSLLENQTAKGLAKYKTTVNADDYTLDGWIKHAQEESIDKLVYLTVIRQKLDELNVSEIVEENKRLREALEFYANPKHYYWDEPDTNKCVLYDKGEKARKILEELK